MADGHKDIIDPNKLYPNVLRFMENSILAFLQVLFSTFPEGQTPRSYHYCDDPLTTEIEIEGQNTDNLQNMDVRPKITVARGPLSWSNTHINSFVGARNLTVEQRRFAAIDRGTVGISCFSRNDLEADQIAHVCYSAIRTFGPVLQRLGYLSIKAAQVGQRGLVKSDSIPTLFVTPVLVQVEITSEWKLKRIDPVQLREVLVQYVMKP
ncbi:MAG: hypothetical protein EBU84_14035 [Actinobacteria bacterium]|nr:hypothetical protein [Actinomycetota bacterium]